MGKAVLIGCGVIGFAVGVKLLARNLRGVDFEKMIERMPEDAPPKWMFRNITEIHSNTEKILRLLEVERVPRDEAVTTAA